MEAAEQQRDPSERLIGAVEGFQALNKTLPAGLPAFELPPFLETAASVDALATLLIAKGFITQDEFVAAKTLRMAEMVEGLIETARELKRQATGLLIAGTNPSV